MTTPSWWKEATVYQIYPFSFQDTTGSGVGDLNGICSRLQYLRDLGVDVIWLSPIYASPLKDMGYDISDYRAINPMLGTMEDWDLLLKETHRLGMKLVMDLVVNHTSDEHEWFRNSKRGGEKKDWYIWRPARDNREPNNWGAFFGGSCWEWVEEQGEYYCHVWDVSQPDLNWENPAVREAVWDVMRFWLEKGCDGFRMDVINCIAKEPGLPDVPVIRPDEKWQPGYLYRANGPRLFDYLDEMHEKVLRHYPAAFTVGETPGIDTPEQAIQFVKEGKPLQMLFNFEWVFMSIQLNHPVFFPRKWKLTDLRRSLGAWMEYMQDHDGWDSLFLENHDQPRIISWWLNDKEFRSQCASMLALFHATGRGTLFIYQGQELGLKNPESWSFDELRDVEAINFYKREQAKRSEGADMSDILSKIQFAGRDNARTPMQWDGSQAAGFTTGTPWIKVTEDYRTWNAESQIRNPDSVLAFWKGMLRIRKDHPCLVYGRLELIDCENEEVYAYHRLDEVTKYLVICSFMKVEVTWKSPVPVGRLLLSNYEQMSMEQGRLIDLRPYEARLYQVR